MAAHRDDRRIPTLGAGRRPAGLALLHWLEDPLAPGLCRVSGRSGAGKSHLLAWLVRACTTEATPRGQRIHAVAPATGQTVRTLSWTLGRQLGASAHGPTALIAALAEDDRPFVVCLPALDAAVEPARVVAELLRPALELPQVRVIVEAPESGPAAVALRGLLPGPAVLELDDPQWTDRAGFSAWCARRGADPGAYPWPGQALGEKPHAGHPPRTFDELLALVPKGAEGSSDLRAAGSETLSALWTAASHPRQKALLTGDPLLRVLAEPAEVSAATECLDDAVSSAWAAAGPALIDEPDPAVRAAVLRTRLLGVDDAAASVLASLPAHWTGRWAQWTAGAGGDGPLDAGAVLASGAGPYAGQLLSADPGGAVRIHDPADAGRRLGSVAVLRPRPLRGLLSAADGSLLLLDLWGGVRLVRPDGRAEPTEFAELVVFAEALTRDGGPVVTAATTVPGHGWAVGDDAGTVHYRHGAGVRSEQLHRGPVTTVAGAAHTRAPLLVSGGRDGAVRLWGPTGEPMPEASDRRDCPVTAVAAGTVGSELLVAGAWSDGSVRVRCLSGRGVVHELRLGSCVRSMAVVADLLVLGLADGVVAIDIDLAPDLDVRVGDPP